MVNNKQNQDIIIDLEFFTVQKAVTSQPQDIAIDPKNVESFDLPQEFFTYFQIDDVKN